MSHIYDALRKSQGDDEPRRPPGDGDAPPPEQPGERPAPLKPEGRVEGALLGEPNAEFLRELGAMRENIDVMLSRSAHRVVGFVGAVVGEGVTTLAVHYAYLMAHLVGKRVLLVDADMARSHLSLSESLGTRPGLSELLSTDIPLEKVVVCTELENLHFLPAGQDQVNHVESVASGPTRSLFDHLGQIYDLVVVDSAPALEHPEAPLIGAACDGVVVVVRAHRTRREIIQRALAELNVARCRILGTVLNAHRASLPGFLRERV